MYVINRSYRVVQSTSSVPTPAAAASYTGPGDIVSGAAAFGGLRAYNAAYATGSNPSVDLHNDITGVFVQTINILSTGALDTVTAAIIIAAGASRIGKIWDQTGNGRHWTQGNNSTRAQLQLTAGPGGNTPSIYFDGVSRGDQYSTSGSAAITQPYSYAAVVSKDVGVGNYTIFGSMAVGSVYFGYRGSNTTLMVASGVGENGITASGSAFHATQAVCPDGTSTNIFFDGNTGTAGSYGTTGYSGEIGFSNDFNGGVWNGLISEAMIWPVGLTGPNVTSINSNQHSYWGF